jgi:transcriptional regulator with XRE-family HTH domain
MPPIAQNIGANIHRVRVGRGWSLRQLSLKSGVDPSYIHRIEKGGVSFGLDMLEKLAAALAVPFAHLFQTPGEESAEAPDVSQPGGGSTTNTALEGDPEMQQLFADLNYLMTTVDDFPGVLHMMTQLPQNQLAMICDIVQVESLRLVYSDSGKVKRLRFTERHWDVQPRQLREAIR